MRVPVILCLLWLAAVASGYSTMHGWFTNNNLNTPVQMTDLKTWTGKPSLAGHIFILMCDADAKSWQINTLQSLWNAGSVPYLSLDPLGCGGASAADPNAAVTSGAYDNFFTAFLPSLKSWLAGPDGVWGNNDDRRVWIRLAHEMDDPAGYAWAKNPTTFRAMWVYVWNKFANYGIDVYHLQWHWCVTVIRSDTEYQRALTYYPGDGYVDWVGADPYLFLIKYNWGSLRYWSTWTDVATVFTVTLSYLRRLAPNKPLHIGETGAPFAGGPTGTAQDKSNWLAALFPFLASQQVSLCVYFNIDYAAPEPDWATLGGRSGYATGSSAWYIPSVANNPRILTDTEFSGQIFGTANRCPGTPACSLHGLCQCIPGWYGASCNSNSPNPTPSPSTQAPTTSPPTPSATVPPTSAPGAQIIYDDALRNGWNDIGSWATVDYAATSPTHSGSYLTLSVSVVYGPWTAWYINLNNAFTTAQYDGLSFWMHGGSTGGQHLSVMATDHSWGTDFGVHWILPTAAVANQWTRVQVTWANLGITGVKSVDGFYIGENDGSNDRHIMYFDDVQLYKSSTPAPTPAPPTSAPTPPPTPPAATIGTTTVTPSVVPVGIPVTIKFTVTITGAAFTGRISYAIYKSNDGSNAVQYAKSNEVFSFPLGVSSFSYAFTLADSTPAGSYKAVVEVGRSDGVVIKRSDPAVVFTTCGACCTIFGVSSATPNPVSRGQSTVVSWTAYTNCAQSNDNIKASFVPPQNSDNSGSVANTTAVVSLVKGSNRLSLTLAIPSSTPPMSYRATLGVWNAAWTSIQFSNDAMRITVN